MSTLRLSTIAMLGLACLGVAGITLLGSRSASAQSSAGCPLTRQQYESMQADGQIGTQIDEAQGTVTYRNGSDCAVWVQYQALSDGRSYYSNPVQVQAGATQQFPMPTFHCAGGQSQDIPLVQSLADGTPVYQERMMLSQSVCQNASMQNSSPSSVSSRSTSSSSSSFSSSLSASSLSRSSFSMSSTPLGSTAQNAQCLGITGPDNVTPNQSFTATVGLRNTGTSTWRRNEGFDLGIRAGQDNANGTLPHDVTPGQVVAVTLNLTAPSQPGNYPMAWQMRRNATDWFGDMCQTILTVGTSPVATTQNLGSDPVTLVAPIANAQDDGDVVTIDISPDTQEASPGSQVWFTINVKNRTDDEYSGLTLTAIYTPSDLLILDNGGGTVGGGRIRWLNGTLAGNESKSLRFLAQLNPQLPHGQYVRVQATVNGGDIEEETAWAQVGVLRELPRTGALKLHPILTGGGSDGSGGTGMIAVLGTMLAGIAAGGLLGRKILPS